ncbi:MAG: hypothetical protein Q9159_004515 [Coniocarpon cinnabarinum]
MIDCHKGLVEEGKRSWSVRETTFAPALGALRITTGNTFAPRSGLQQRAKEIETSHYEAASSRQDYLDLCQRSTSVAASFRHTPAPIGVQHHDRDQLPPSAVRIGHYEHAVHYRNGIFSEVYRAPAIDASDMRVADFVAIKVTTPSMMIAPHDSRREARVLQFCQGQAHTIPLVESFERAGDTFVLVFPFMPFSLDMLLKENQLDQDDSMRILQDLLQGLAFLHENQIIHRDIKPSNVLLRAIRGPVYLADFGIAWRHADRASEEAHNKITDVGTTCYRPPEILFGRRDYNCSLDMWAAGCVAAEVVNRSSKPLFEAGNVGTELALIRSIFMTLGTPDETTWPGAADCPDWGKMHCAAERREPESTPITGLIEMRNAPGETWSSAQKRHLHTPASTEDGASVKTDRDIFESNAPFSRTKTVGPRGRTDASHAQPPQSVRQCTAGIEVETKPRTNKKFADYSTRMPAVEHPPFMVIHEEAGAWEGVDVTHVEDVVWDASSTEWIGFDDKFEVGSVQQRPKEWPKQWQWPFDVLRNRETVDGSCLNCASGPKEPCLCLPAQWRHKIDWAPLRILFHSKEAGVGVRTRTAWKKGDVLGDYVGVLRPYNDFEENFYSFVVPLRKSFTDPVAMIDASKAGNWTRFMNHSKDDPNVEIALNRVGSQRVLVARATRDIGWGEELRLHYGCLWFFEENDPYKPEQRTKITHARHPTRRNGAHSPSPDDDDVIQLDQIIGRQPRTKKHRALQSSPTAQSKSYVTVSKQKTSRYRIERVREVERPKKPAPRKSATARG